MQMPSQPGAARHGREEAAKGHGVRRQVRDP